jgi:hypothetical protein
MQQIYVTDAARGVESLAGREVAKLVARRAGAAVAVVPADAGLGFGGVHIEQCAGGESEK